MAKQLHKGDEIHRRWKIIDASRSGDGGWALIEPLWREHEAARFPRASRCREVAGHDLIALDYTTAGCVSTFLARGALDTWRLAVLGLCYRGLSLVVAELDGEELTYFSRLERLAGLVLEAVRDGSQPG